MIMKLLIFIVSGIFILVGSKAFPDFLTAVFFLIMLISGMMLIVAQKKRK